MNDCVIHSGDKTNTACLCKVVQRLVSSQISAHGWCKCFQQDAV